MQRPRDGTKLKVKTQQQKKTVCLEYGKNEESGEISEEEIIVSHSRNSRFDMKDIKRLLEGLKQRSDLI